MENRKSRSVETKKIVLYVFGKKRGQGYLRVWYVLHSRSIAVLGGACRAEVSSTHWWSVLWVGQRLSSRRIGMLAGHRRQREASLAD
jgi:hypothetical protein